MKYSIKITEWNDTMSSAHESDREGMTHLMQYNYLTFAPTKAMAIEKYARFVSYVLRRPLMDDPKPYLTSVVEWSFDLSDGIEVKIAVKQIDD